MRNIYACTHATPLKGYYPAYISVNVTDDEDAVEVTVRTEGKPDPSIIRLTWDQWNNLCCSISP